MPRIELPVIVASEETPLVKKLVGIVEQLHEHTQQQTETIQQLRDEIARLKGEKGKPKFKPSGMEQKAGKKKDEPNGAADAKPRPGSAKRAKTAELVIHEEDVRVPCEPVPRGSRFKGYRDVVVQELKITAHNTRYRLQVWETPDGRSLVGQLPPALQGHHFGPVLRGYILYQHHHCQVTQPLLHEQLREWGIDISTGQIDALLTAGKEDFFAEKDQLLATGLAVSDFITVDDSGARHQGENGYVTHIGNDFFAWFGSTKSKSRINFLGLLHAGSIAYRVNGEALTYMQEQGLTEALRRQLQTSTPADIASAQHWQEHLEKLGIFGERHQRIATEGALIGALLEKENFNPALAIVSDGAGQFAILAHALCWIHTERLVHKLIPMNDLQRAVVEQVREQIWDLYADLKAYRLQPDASRIAELQARFTATFTQRTGYATLNGILKRTWRRKQEMLLVLRRPEVPLHTNGSETAIRDYVKKRKISGGTRSDLGRTCRDTFASLKKTCRKLGISFWDYLIDRISLANTIPPLPDIVRQRAAAYLGASP
ncbi:MAG: IS66 family transposase [Acidiferrobacterales bacterium]